jgi:hypothetical protein
MPFYRENIKKGSEKKKNMKKERLVKEQRTIASNMEKMYP